MRRHAAKGDRFKLVVREHRELNDLKIRTTRQKQEKAASQK